MVMMTGTSLHMHNAYPRCGVGEVGRDGSSVFMPTRGPRSLTNRLFLPAPLQLPVALEKAQSLDVKTNRAGSKQAGQPASALGACCLLPPIQPGLGSLRAAHRQQEDGCQRDHKSKQTRLPGVLWFGGEVQTETAGQDQERLNHRVFAVKSSRMEGVQKGRAGWRAR